MSYINPMETTEKIPKGDIQKKMKRIKEWYYQKKKKSTKKDSKRGKEIKKATRQK